MKNLVKMKKKVHTLSTEKLERKAKEIAIKQRKKIGLQCKQFNHELAYSLD